MVKTTTIELLIILVCLLCLLAAVFAVGKAVTSDDADYVRILNSQGYTNVDIQGTAFTGCAKEDSPLNSVQFTAKGVNQATVHGVICCGLLLKGCTVRIDL